MRVLNTEQMREADRRTIEEIEKEISERLAEYIREPKVTVQLVQVHSMKYMVVGDVTTPGIYEMTRRMTVNEALAKAVDKLKKRGIRHPYVKNYVLARTTPLTRARKMLPGFEQTFKKLRTNIDDFDVSRVRYEDIQRAGLMAAPASSE